MCILSGDITISKNDAIHLLRILRQVRSESSVLIDWHSPNEDGDYLSDPPDPVAVYDRLSQIDTGLFNVIDRIRTVWLDTPTRKASNSRVTTSWSENVSS